MKKKVMVIGAGAGQIPIIKLCQKEGLYTYAVSPNGPYPGIELADCHINEDIYNVDNLVKIGKELKIDYVISDQSDYAVPLVAYIADKLGLPGVEPEVAQTYSYKSKFRSFCEANDIPAPKAIEIEKETILPNFNFPVIVKPSDSQGSRGINKVEDKAGLANAIQEAFSYSKRGSVVVEDFFLRSEENIILLLLEIGSILNWRINSYLPKRFFLLPYQWK